MADDSNYRLLVWWFKKESCVAIKVRAKQHPRENSSSCGKLMKQEKYQLLPTKEMLWNNWWILIHGAVLVNNGFKM